MIFFPLKFLGIIFFFFLSLQAGWTPLHIAASAGRDEIVKALLDKGAHVNAVNQNGCTPLHYAASKNKQEVGFPVLLGVVSLLEEVFNLMDELFFFPTRSPVSSRMFRLQSCF